MGKTLLEDEMEDEMEDLDSTWLDDFENLDKDYTNYYTEDLSFIKIHLVYVNKTGDIEKVKEEKIMLKSLGILQKEELIGIIKHNSFCNNMKYSLLSILKFNIDIQPVNLKKFLKSKNKHIGSSFLHTVKNIDSIYFEKSITLFHDINEVIIIFASSALNVSSALNASSASSNNHTKKRCIGKNVKPAKNKTKRI